MKERDILYIIFVCKIYPFMNIFNNFKKLGKKSIKLEKIIYKL